MFILLQFLPIICCSSCSCQPFSSATSSWSSSSECLPSLLTLICLLLLKIILLILAFILLIIILLDHHFLLFVSGSFFSKIPSCLSSYFGYLSYSSPVLDSLSVPFFFSYFL